MVKKNDIFFKRDALSNNTFDLDTVEKSIEEIKMSSFNYLYKVQIDMMGYKRFDFTMSDLQRSNTINHIFSMMPRRWVLYVPGDFIDEGDRLAFRRSKFYEKEICYDDTLNHRALFPNTYLVFIDGKLCLEGVNIYCKEEKTYCVFNLKEKPRDKNGIPKKDFDNFMNKNANVTVIFMPNYSNMNLKTNAYALKHSNTRNGLSIDTLNNEGTICFARTEDSCYGEMLTNSSNENKIFVDENYLNNVIKTHKDTTLYLNFLNFKYLHKVIDIGPNETDKWFELEIQDYPIAIDSCFIFDEKGNYMHNLKIDMYYPNIYHIVGDTGGKKVKVYVFYFKSNMMLQHKNALAVYYKYTRDVLDRYKRDSIPEIIKNYKPAKVTYDINDYHGSKYFDDHFKYKVERMRDLTRLDGEWFRDYLINLALKNNYYLIDVSKISNLEKKIRHDNKDVGESEIVKFDEPMYMFVFSNEFRNKHDNLIALVDGIKYSSHLLYKTKSLDFLYIPVSLVNKNSIIEIEKMREVIREYEFIGEPVNVRTSIDIDDLAMQNRPLLNDIFLVDMETKKYISTSEYELYARIGEDVIDVATHDLFIPCPKHVEVRLVNPELVGKKIMFHIKKNYRFFKVYTQHGKDNIYPVKAILDGKNDSRHLRLYRNGRVVPRHIPTVRFPDHYNFAETQLFPGFLREDGDTLILESLPYKMTQVCYLEKLENNKIVDLTGLIDKPFDLRWHDVYLNGRKLNRHDIEIISSNKIVIRNTKSLRWLEVVENSRDDEYFGYFPLNDIIDKILDSKDDDGFKDRIEETITGMTDIEKDIITEIVTIIDYIMNMFYFDYMIPYYGLINPDIHQIDKETHDFYHEIMDGAPFLLNGDYGRKPVYRELPVNPDKEFGE